MSHTPYSRNRQRIGGAVLTSAEVALIKRRLLDGIEAPRDIGNSYGVSTETIRRIGRGDAWGWVEPAEPGTEAELERFKSPEVLAAEAAESFARLLKNNPQILTPTARDEQLPTSSDELEPSPEELAKLKEYGLIR